VELGGDSHLGSAPGRQPAWPAVMEAAYAKMAERKNENLDQGFAHIDSGGQARDALYTLTGEKSQTITASSFKHMVLDEAYNKLDGALKEGRPLLLATNPMKDIPTDGLVKGDAHINAGHEYMLEDISKSADGNVQLTLRNPWGHNYDPAQGVTSKDATVNVDLKTIINNGHLESIDIGPKAIEKKQERDQNKNQDQQQTHQAKTGDPAFDKLLNGLGNHDATTKALQELAQSPSGQAFHAEGRAQYAEVQNQQLQAQIAQQQVQMQSQAPAQAQAGPVMTR